MDIDETLTMCLADINSYTPLKSMNDEFLKLWNLVKRICHSNSIKKIYKPNSMLFLFLWFKMFTGLASYT